MERKTPDPSSSSGLGKGAMCGFFLIFALAGLVMAYFLTFRPISGLVAAQSWEPISCKILSSEVETNRGSDSSTYRIDITYEYEFQGATYTGDRYNFSLGSSSGYEGKAEVVAAHPPGLETLCFVDPNDPLTSVIDRSPGLYLLWGLFPLPFLLVGFGGLLGVLLGGKAKAMAKSTSGSSATAGSAARGSTASKFASVMSPAGETDGEIDATGPLALESSNPPLANGIGLGIFALLWNGFVMAGLYMTSSDEGIGFATVFLIPFVLVGLLVFGAAIHQLLASTNPRPHLVLTPARPSLGASCQLQWSLTGRSVQIDRIKILLEGREAATYRRGTNTSTDHAKFHESVLYEGQRDIRHMRMSSTLSFTVPEHSMPSFEADNNKIEWRIIVHGDIPRWPDIKEEFPITIMPPREGSAR